MNSPEHGDEHRELRAVYDSPEFWKAYTQIWWCGPGEDGAIANILSSEPADELLAHLARSKSTQPLRVLALGLGVGTMEFPLLHALRAATGREIELVGLDSSGGALRVADQILGLGLNQLPTTARIVEFINVLGKQGSFGTIPPPPPRTNAMLVKDDLDLESDQSPELPSYWALRLHDTLRKTQVEPRFDLILAAFCLFHLKWWRPAMVDAIEMLDEQGALLIPRIRGDSLIINGLTGHPAPPARMIERVFRSFYGDEKVRSSGFRLRSNTAIGEYAVDDFLAALGSARITERGLRYEYETVGTLGTYRTLLESRGLSPFWLIARGMGDEAYLRAVESAIDSAGGDEADRDTLRFALNWSIFSAPKRRRTAVSPLIHRLGAEPAKRGSRQAASPLVLATQRYELAEAASDMHPDAATQPELLVEHLLTRGLLPTNIQGGVLATDSLRRSRLATFSLFHNPAHYRARSEKPEEARRHADRFRASLAAFQLFLKYGRLSSTYSNTSVLLEELLPKSPLPPLFVYEPVENQRAPVQIILIRRRTFVEVRFKFLKERRLKAMICTPEIEKLRIDLTEVIRKEGETANIYSAPALLEKLVERRELNEQFVRAVRSSRDALLHELKARGTIEDDEQPSLALRESVLEWQDLPHSGLVSAILKTLSTDMLLTTLYMHIFDMSSQVLSVPFTYVRGTGMLGGDDCLWLLSKKSLERFEIEQLLLVTNTCYASRAQLKRGQEAEFTGRDIGDLSAIHDLRRRLKNNVTQAFNELDRHLHAVLPEREGASAFEGLRKLKKSIDGTYAAVDASVQVFQTKPTSEIPYESLTELTKAEAKIFQRTLKDRLIDYAPIEVEVDFTYLNSTADRSESRLEIPRTAFFALLELILRNACDAIQPQEGRSRRLAILVKRSLADTWRKPALVTITAYGAHFTEDVLLRGGRDRLESRGNGSGLGLFIIAQALRMLGAWSPTPLDDGQRPRSVKERPLDLRNHNENTELAFCLPVRRQNDTNSRR